MDETEEETTKNSTRNMREGAKELIMQKTQFYVQFRSVCCCVRSMKDFHFFLLWILCIYTEFKTRNLPESLLKWLSWTESEKMKMAKKESTRDDENQTNQTWVEFKDNEKQSARPSDNDIVYTTFFYFCKFANI